MSNRIDIPVEGVTVTATCSDCLRPLARVAGGSVSWRCDTESCWVRIVPMFEDARFVDDDGTEWIITDEDEWVDVVEDDAQACTVCRGSGYVLGRTCEVCRGLGQAQA